MCLTPFFPRRYFFPFLHFRVCCLFEASSTPPLTLGLSSGGPSAVFWHRLLWTFSGLYSKISLGHAFTHTPRWEDLQSSGHVWQNVIYPLGTFNMCGKLCSVAAKNDNFLLALEAQSGDQQSHHAGKIFGRRPNHITSQPAWIILQLSGGTARHHVSL